MKRNMTLLRRLCCLLLAVLFGAGLLPADSAMTAHAQGPVLTMTNVVIFARLNGDTNDDFNRPKVDTDGNPITDTNGRQINDSWQRIYAQYETGNAPDGFNNSFKNYISVISGGRVQVNNVFPQVDLNTGRINVLELPKESYDSFDKGADAQLIEDVVGALSAAQDAPTNPLYIDKQHKLDNREAGVLDNLTIILQGADINGNDHSFKSNYSGSETIRGVTVSCCNVMPSKNLIDVTGEDGKIQYAGFGGQGVVAHEFLHTLGLPDLYRSGGSGIPVGPWDVMGTASYVVQYPLAYQRNTLNWLEKDTEVQEISQSGDYTLTAADKPGGVKLIMIKTPLSESASEIICLEYRQQNKNYHDFEWTLPESGLLMYRVDNKVEDKTNFGGKNYIYVYRPGVTTPEGAADTKTIEGVERNNVFDAALGNGETYGSTDLSADFTKNTLYYSTGRNSGVQISNVQMNGNTVSFHVEFAEYGDLWQGLGDVAAADVLTPKLYADEATGKLYLAYVNMQMQLLVKQWDATNGTWKPLGGAAGTAAHASDLSLAACGGKLYLSFWDSDGHPSFTSWDGSAWSAAEKINDESYPASLQLVTNGSDVYAAYQTGGSSRRIKICALNGSLTVESPMTAQDFCNPTVVMVESKFYIAYTEFAKQQAAKIDSYDIQTGKWESVYTYQQAFGNTNLLCAQNGRLYAMAGDPIDAAALPALAVWNGTKWTETPIPDAKNFFQMNLTVAGQTPYLSFFDNTARKAQLLRLSNGQWESCYDGLNGSVEYFEAVNIGTQVYAAIKAQGTQTVSVYAQQVTLAPDDPTNPGDPVTPPSPEIPAGVTLSLTPPAGYTDPIKIHVDGVEYEAQKNGGSLTVQLPDTSGKIATMYYYKSNGAPGGMYVWRLSYSGSTCTATPLPGLQDLISYHGFSIRVQSPSGLRFKSGIDIGLRARLLSGGVDGYRLREYGTMSMAASNLGRRAFVLGEPKVRAGRSYWTDNGKVNDFVLETVSGRYRFASVMINIPKEQYANDIAFRAYMILQDALGNEVTVYGPYVKRSVYYVANQVAAAGEFKPGSSGYQYVQGILQSVNK